MNIFVIVVAVVVGIAWLVLGFSYAQIGADMRSLDKAFMPAKKKSRLMLILTSIWEVVLYIYRVILWPVDLVCLILFV